ncbi:hypothetical protein [Qipengyuania marisflavi]|uniref:Lipoprotein n=1 Tax=Qipengyuania marisflavi TaxID=2486356 RepID=A0A5S3P978_9SPHN|nr:hypothetical protein [Qipengyuania marisflavi]TMM49996.1 hypothetical protein FEV51_02005 [Qipengyuania marisflavi]
MIGRLTFPAALLMLAACSQQPAEQESADDFAARIGGEATAESTSAANDPSQPTMDMPNKAQAAPPAGADVTQLEQLGDVGGVNLGPREGGCTFMTGGKEMIIAAGLRDKGMSGKGVIRVGDGLVLLDSGPGGLDRIKRGTNFSGEGVTVTVSPAAGEAQTRPANVTVTGADGKAASYSGNWICA